MIIFQDVCKVFDSREVLRRIDWRIRTGERWLVSGASGIGKTTLLRLLMGLDTPDSGMVTGTDGLRFAPVFQEDRLVEHWSAMANVWRLRGHWLRKAMCWCWTSRLPGWIMRRRCTPHR